MYIIIQVNVLSFITIILESLNPDYALGFVMRATNVIKTRV